MSENNQPLVSVLIASYNHARFLDETIGSVLAQTYQNWELLITDDASTDDSAAVLRRYAEQHPGRIRVFLHERNRGVSSATNNSLAAARGQYLAILGSDDRMRPGRLAAQVAYLEANPQVGAVFTPVNYIDGDGRQIEPNDDVFGLPIHDLRRQLLLRNFLNAPSAMMRREVAAKVGRFNPALDYTQDYDYWLRALDHAELRRLPERLTDYRVHGNNLSVGGAQGLKVASHYESAMVCLRALDRLPPDFFNSDPHEARLEIARHCLLLDRAYFGRALLATGTAYRLVLEVLDSVPEHDGARRVLKDVYRMLGDAPRAEGKGSMPLAQWQAGQSAAAAPAGPTGEQRYQTWLKKHTLEEIDGQLHAERMMIQWRKRPLFHFIAIARRGEESRLADTVDAAAAQLYPDWRLTIVSDAPPPAEFSEVAGRLEWVSTANGESITDTVNRVACDIEADWVLMARAGDRFAPQLLLAAGDYIHLKPAWKLLYTDEDNVDERGERSSPRFKPDFNLDLLRSMPYLGAAVIAERETLAALGGIRCAGAEIHDLALRVLDAHGENAIGHIADVLWHTPAGRSPDYDEAVGRMAVAEHLARRGIAATVEASYQPGTFRVVYPLDGSPRVSIIVPTRDKLDCLKPCLESVLAKTAWPNYELIVVDNQSEEPETLAFLEQFVACNPNRVRVLRYDHPFNYAAISNMAARAASGEYLVLLNNDTQVLHGDWLERMLRHASRPEVGTVGVRLIYPETRKLQHAGVIVGMVCVADHVYNGRIGLDEPGYMGRAQVDQNFSAVTAACLMIRKSVYEQIGGMDEEGLKVLFNDVDLCLKVGEAGHKIVWTPHVTLAHHGSASIKRDAQDAARQEAGLKRAERERFVMQERWLPRLANDPAWNRNLSLMSQDPVTEHVVVANWDPNFHDRPRLLGNSPTGGAAEYRMLAPLRALSRAALAQTDVIDTGLIRQARVLMPAELERVKPDVYLLHAAITDFDLEVMSLYRRLNRDTELVYGLDDLVTNLPEKNHFKRDVPRDIRERLARALSYCDRAIVATEPLKELCRGMIGDVRVVPNRLERAVWESAVPKREPGARPRVGWAGAQQHLGDLLVLREVLETTAHEVDWVFFGMCPEELRPFVREVHDFVLDFRQYPKKLASLNLDLAIAPLEIHPFNEAKSNLRLLEYGWMGWPVVCTDILPYQGAPVERVPNDPKRWIEAIRARVHDRDAAREEGKRLREWVRRRYVLEDHLEEWYRALVPAKWRQMNAQAQRRVAGA
jgi:glycosyltransferase involved in cell wall biosynthesis